jgi:hypothetical protein
MKAVFNDTNEANKTIELAIGRILRLDNMIDLPDEEKIKQYETCRSLILDAFDFLGVERPNISLGYCKPGYNFGNSILE